MTIGSGLKNLFFLGRHDRRARRITYRQCTALILLALASSATQRADATTPIPVLTVCEVLSDLSRYDGKLVIVVGRSVRTSEGSWLDEECSAKLSINGRDWPNAISTTYNPSWSPPPPPKPRDFNWSRPLLQDKLKQVRKTTQLRIYHRRGWFDDHWYAAFG